MSLVLTLAFSTLVAMTMKPVDAPFRGAVETAAVAAIAKHLTPGIAIGVVRNGAIVYEQGFGSAGSAGRPVTPATRFAIGSLTKQFTAAAVLLSANARKLDLDGTLAAYLPQLPNAQLITIRELLHQTSGLHNYPNLGEHNWPLTGSIDPGSLFALLASDPSDFTPGTRFEYSNTNYTALADIVARANGTSYGSLLASTIFAPLGMTNSAYGFSAERTGDAVPTGADGSTWVADGDRLSLDLFYGAGGIISTAHDMSLWNAALLEGTLVDDATRRLLWEPGRLADGSATAYAMGFVPAEMNRHREVWHNGYAPNAGGYCYSALFPDDRVGIVVLTNSGNAAVEAVSQTIVRDVLESYSPPVALADEPAVSARVRTLLAQLRAGSLDRAALTPEFSTFLSPVFVLAVKPYFTTLGEPTSLVLEEKSAAGARTFYRYRGAFSDGSVHDVRLVLEGDKVGGFQVPP